MSSLQALRTEPNISHLKALVAPTQKSSRPVVRILTSDEERQAAFRLRYEIYVEEMGREEEYADHEARTVIDPYDDTAIIVGAFKGDELIGTSRINFTDDTVIPHENLYDLRFFKLVSNQPIGIVEKLMVKNEFRNGLVLLEIVKLLYRVALERNSRFSVIDCNDHLVKTYSRLGFKKYGEKFFFDKYGYVTKMMIDAQNPNYLKSIRSPFYPIYKRFFN